MKQRQASDVGQLGKSINCNIYITIFSQCNKNPFSQHFLKQRNINCHTWNITSRVLRITWSWQFMGCGVEANYCNRINRWFVGIFVNDRAQTTDIAAGRCICQIRHIWGNGNHCKTIFFASSVFGAQSTSTSLSLCHPMTDLLNCIVICRAMGIG